MIISIILTGLAILGYILEFINKQNPKKLNYGKWILVISILGLIGNNFSQSKSNSDLIDKLEVINQSHDAIKNKYDSIKIQYGLIVQELDSTKKVLNGLNTNTLNGFKRNEDYFKSIQIKNIERRRILTDQQQKNLIELLSTKSGNILIGYNVTDDQEIISYTQFFIDVFTKAGWIVNNTKYLGFGDGNMAELNFIIKDINDPNIQEYLNIINEAFSKAELNFKIRIYPEMNSKELISLFISKG
jgi:hypothetical protein